MHAKQSRQRDHYTRQAVQYDTRWHLENPNHQPSYGDRSCLPLASSRAVDARG